MMVIHHEKDFKAEQRGREKGQSSLPRQLSGRVSKCERDAAIHSRTRANRAPTAFIISADEPQIKSSLRSPSILLLVDGYWSSWPILDWNHWCLCASLKKGRMSGPTTRKGKAPRWQNIVLALPLGPEF